jgi:hypothetical protein
VNYSRKFSFLDETAMRRLHAAVTVLIATDMDAPGQRLAEALATCIGYAMCRGVSRAEGRKDANAVLGKLGARAVRDALAEARSYSMPALPAHGTHPIRMLPPSRGRRPSAELSPVEASHAR